MIEAFLDPETRHTDPDYKRKEREAKRACKEAAGWQCEWRYANGARCSARQGQLRRKKGRHGEPDGWKITHLHGCHVGNTHQPLQQYICLCARHHTEYDRGLERQEHVNYYRRGYRMTSTDTLLEAMQYTGMSVWEEPDGYHWQIDGTTLGGQRTTAAGAVGAGIAQMNGLLALAQRERETTYRMVENLQQQLISQHTVPEPARSL